MQRLKTEVEASSGDVDIFLSCEWPADITSTLIPSSLPKGLSTTGQTQAALPLPPNMYASLLLKFGTKMPGTAALVLQQGSMLGSACHSPCWQQNPEPAAGCHQSVSRFPTVVQPHMSSHS